MFTLGALGAGHMGLVVLDAAVDAGFASPTEILVYDANVERLELSRARGFAIAGGEAEVFTNSAYVLLALRPQADILEPVMKTLAAAASRGPERKSVVISIMAGISSRYIRGFLGEDAAVVTVMPSIAMRCGHGAAALARTENVPDEAFARIMRIFASHGIAETVDEPLLKEVVAANGCSPGYAYYFLDALARAVAERGADYGMAVRMAAHSFAGAALTILKSEETPRALLAEVCTPGGLTAAGIDAFEKGGMADLVKEGARRSIERGYELAR